MAGSATNCVSYGDCFVCLRPEMGDVCSSRSVFQCVDPFNNQTQRRHIFAIIRSSSEVVARRVEGPKFCAFLPLFPLHFRSFHLGSPRGILSVGKAMDHPNCAFKLLCEPRPPRRVRRRKCKMSCEFGRREASASMRCITTTKLNMCGIKAPFILRNARHGQ